MRLVTYNVQGCARGVAWVGGALRELGADVVCLNEVHLSHLRELERLTARRAIFGAAHRVGWFGRFGNAILARARPRLLASARLPRSPGLEPRAYLVVESDGLVVATTHLGLVEGERLAHVERIVGELSAHHRVVLAGDLNDMPGSPTVERVAQQFRDAYAAAGRDDGDPGNTFPSTAPERRIDYVFTRGLTVSECRAADVNASDHRPVVAEIEIS